MTPTKPPTHCTTPPLFPVGFPLRIGYMGLYRADEQPTNSAGKPVDMGYTVQGMRLIPDSYELEPPDCDSEEPYQTVLVHRRGWEYLAARVTRAGRYDEDGWFTEAALLAKGYIPPPAPAEPLTETDIRDCYLDTIGGE